MIITQTPLRMSFAGGGSDLPSFYRQFGGAVVSTAIDKYVYVNVNKKFDNWIRLSYSRTEEVESVDQIEHRLVRAALQKLNIRGGLEITSIADIPSRGTGLGSSSSFAVGLLLALHAYQSRYISPGDLAEEGCTVEIDLCAEPIGKQDQYAAAFGGLNFFRFEPDDSVIVEPILCSGETLQRLQSSLITFYTGKTRRTSSILNEQSEQAESNKTTQGLLRRMVKLAHDLRTELNRGHVEALGEILDEGWRLKREVHPGVSSSAIDDWYAGAKRAGAVGGNTTSATVTFGPYSSTITLASGDTSTGIVSGALVTVSSTITTNLSFTSNTPGDVGSILDNVFVRTSIATVPEPSSLFLFVSGLLGLGFVAVLARSERCGRQIL